jgi:TrmH family RNA methyltransferase
MSSPLSNISVVLVGPKNPGNIGSVVRAMKNMGLSDLRLVTPVDFRDHEDQKKMGYRSQEIVEASREFPTLREAVADIGVVMIATAKGGKWKKDFLAPEEAAARAFDAAMQQRVALVFGREDKGVTVDECQLANYLIRIPMLGTYPSLNLSQAVMVVAYEVFKASRRGPAVPSSPKMAERSAFDRLETNWWELMKDLGLSEPDGGLFHRSLKRALTRTHWTVADIAVFDRACKQVRWYVENRCRIHSREES